MDRTWKVFIVLSVLYVFFSFSFNLARFRTLPAIIEQNSDLGYHSDYKVITQVSAIAASGVWPWDNTPYFYRGLARVPVYLIYMGGYTSFCGLIIRYTGLLPEFVIYVLVPFLIAAILPVLVWIFGRRVKFTSEQTLLFFILIAFMSNYGGFRFTTPTGETLGLWLGILGIAYYKNHKYIKSGILCGFATWLHFMNISIPLILGGGFLLTTLVCALKKKDIEWKAIYTLLVSLFLFSLVLHPYVTTKTVYLAQVNVTTLNMGVLPPIVVKPNTYIWNMTVVPITKVLGSAEKSTTSMWLVPRTFQDCVLVFFYPVTYFYYGYPGRTSVAHVSQLFGHTLTQEQVEDMRGFKLTSENWFPASVGIFFNCGLPLMFYLVWGIVLKERKLEDITLALSAYLLPIIVALAYPIFGNTIFVERTLPFTELFLIILLVVHIQEVGDKRSIFLKFMSSVVIIRFLVWVMVWW